MVAKSKEKEKRSPPPVNNALRRNVASPAKKATAGNGSSPASTDNRKLGKKRSKTFASRLGRTLLLLAKVGAVIALVSLVLAYSPFLMDIEPIRLEIPTSPRPLTGPLALNDRLDKAEKLFRDYIVGPESIAFHDGDLYTGLHNGWIVRIKDEKSLEPILTVGDPEAETWEEDKRGRPLGLRFDGNGNLYFADSYYGLFKADVKTGVATALYRSSDEVNGKKSKIVNDLDISSSGEDIYFTDASTKFQLKQASYELLEAATNGRVLHYNVKTNTTRQIMDNLAFPNGVQLSADESTLLICETSRYRILKHYLRGENVGKTEVFVDKLPGMPDNIRSNGEGGYWVAIVIYHPPEAGKNIMSMLGPHPIIRKVIARFIDSLQSVLKFVDRLTPSVIMKTTIYKLAHLAPVLSYGSSKGLVLELDGSGNIINSLESQTSSIRFISQVTRHGQHLYLGSPWNGYLAKLKL